VWEVIRLRAKGEWLGTVQAKDEKAALKVAMKQFSLNAYDAQRLLIRPA